MNTPRNTCFMLAMALAGACTDGGDTATDTDDGPSTDQVSLSIDRASPDPVLPDVVGFQLHLTNRGSTSVDVAAAPEGTIVIEGLTLDGAPVDRTSSPVFVYESIEVVRDASRTTLAAGESATTTWWTLPTSDGLQLAALSPDGEGGADADLRSLEAPGTYVLTVRYVFEGVTAGPAEVRFEVP